MEMAREDFVIIGLCQKCKVQYIKENIVEQHNCNMPNQENKDLTIEHKNSQ